MGCVQWTFSRTGDLIECYKTICATNYPTEEECCKAESILIKRELKGDYSYIYSNWMQNQPDDIETSVKAASDIIFTDYEVPGTNDKEERANDAWAIYQIVVEGKDSE